MKKRVTILALAALLLLSGCTKAAPPAQIAATTAPVYAFTQAITQGSSLTVCRLVTESVSCLHDYSLNVNQVRAAEGAEQIVISGAGLEEFMEDILDSRPYIDASQGIELHMGEEHEHEHEDEHEEHHHGDGHDHEFDPHIWLSPANAAMMARNICDGLSQAYPEHRDLFETNLEALLSQLEELDAYGRQQLGDLSCRELLTFHDGFGYFAEAYDLEILAAVEEESGSEASARELSHLIELTKEHALPAVFTEVNGSPSAASVICRECGIPSYALDMAMGSNYFDAMYHNIDTLKEALG